MDHMRAPSVSEVFHLLADQSDPDSFCQFCMIVWAVWENRNARLNGGRVKSPDMVVFGAIKLLEEFRISKLALTPTPTTSPLCLPTDWMVPPPGRLKLNTDVAFRRNSASIGAGAAIRDYKGKVIAARSSTLLGAFSVEAGHLLAIREGLNLARFYNIPISIAECSSPAVVSLIGNPLSSLRENCFIINDIKALCSEVGFCKCQASSRKGNSLAHKLASVAFSSVRECLWLDPNPCSVFSAL